MANTAGGSGNGCLITFPGSGVDFTQGAPARIRPLFFYGGNYASQSPGVNNSFKLGFSDVSSGNTPATENPSVYSSNARGWLCRTNVLQNNTPGNPGYSSFDASIVGFPNPASNPQTYSFSMSIYWQGSEAGNCLEQPFAGLSSPSEQDFLDAVAASGTGSVPPWNGDQATIEQTYDIWKVSFSIQSSMDTIQFNACNSLWESNGTSPCPAYPDQGGANHIISFYDDYGSLGTSGLIGDTKTVLNTGVNVRLW